MFFPRPIAGFAFLVALVLPWPALAANVQDKAAQESRANSISFEDAQTTEEFKQWLRKLRIPFEVTSSGGKERVWWKNGNPDLARQFIKERSAVRCSGKPEITLDPPRSVERC